jgi:hypothetical protein
MAADRTLSNIYTGPPPVNSPWVGSDGNLGPVDPNLARMLTPQASAWLMAIFRRVGVQAGRAGIVSGTPTTGFVQGVVANPTIQDTHANLPQYDAKQYIGMFYYKTDWKVLYLSIIVAGVPGWYYVAGVMTGLLMNIPPAAGLGLSDVGLEYESTDFRHRHKFNGAVWQFTAGDGSGQIEFAADGFAPRGGFWQICDGSTVTIANDNASIGTVTTPDLIGAQSLIGASSFVGRGFVAAARSTWEVGARTETEAAHTHPITQNVVNQGAGGAYNVDVATPTGAGSAHSHLLLDANARLKVPSETNGGLGRHYNAVPYMRR